jgi:hypothetical protein
MSELSELVEKWHIQQVPLIMLETNWGFKLILDASLSVKGRVFFGYYASPCNNAN